MRQKNIILAARLLSMMFTPFYLSTVGLIVLFTFSYLSLAPWQYKLRVIGMVYLFTILMPTLLIRFYRQYHGWTLLELGRQEKRMVPYVISILCYAGCYTLMEITHIPHFMSIILMAALAIQMCCVVINIWWKISTHTSAIGGVAGALQAFAVLFSFNPLWWLCLVFIVAGMVGTSRMILRQHTLWQVVAGFLVGQAVAFTLIMLNYLVNI
jgi:membrane-associated phospholipid phosphatase|uniref:phosphatase PAP2 family protein n=1 Tax=Prevotella sp. TaxID=59823 RepID=UPI004029C8A7